MPDFSQGLPLNSNQIQIGVFLGGILGGLIAGWMLRGRQSRETFQFGRQLSTSTSKAGASIGKPVERVSVSSKKSGKASPHSHGDSDWLSTSEEEETGDAAAKKPLRSRSKSKPMKQALKMNFLVRMDLDMGKGKICAQVAHAAVGAYEEAVRKRDPNLRAWQRYGQAKVALKVPDEETLLSLTQQAKEAGLNVYVVRDAGRTQIAAGSLTVAAIGPGEVSAVDKITGHLKLL
ncbi:hypothetical protein RvY_05136 [Ramazzottius varieornatus]|uniref:peptidyl-tRNA hydrolase n=1 Tax=Ramazzottius varieornatus TaxID=947166 RepID=A0A1D1V322_RAMVA|nr:hypothetical protein RvY_05136 [Ramazzottius varieornatus]